MDDLPALCVDLIGLKLAALCSKDPEWRIARTAARMARVSREFHQAIASPLYDVLDPNCVETWKKHVDQDTRERDEILGGPLPSATLEVDANSKITDLKQACKTLGCASTGTKAVLWANLQEAVELARSKRKVAEDLASERVCPKPLACPVRSAVRALVKAQCKEPEVLVTLTTCRKEFGLKDEDLENLEVELRNNPRYRSAAPMRLYNKLDVLRRVIEVRGPGVWPLTFGQELASREADLKKSKALKARYIKRQADAKQIVETAHDLDENNRGREITKAIDDYASGAINRGEFVQELTALVAKRNRRRDLIIALDALGCELRSDSRLCEAYVEEGIGSPAEIATVMREMKFYFDHTDYQAFHNAAYEERRQNRRYYDYDEEYESNSMSTWAKERALEQWINTTPNACDDPLLPLSLKARVIQTIKKLVAATAHKKNQIRIVQQILPKIPDTCVLTLTNIVDFGTDKARELYASGICPFCNSQKGRTSTHASLPYHLANAHGIRKEFLCQSSKKGI